MLRRHSRGAWIVAAAVLSHWVLDFVTHRPDLPLWPPEGRCVGLGLWNSLAERLLPRRLLFALGPVAVCHAHRSDATASAVTRSSPSP